MCVSYEDFWLQFISDFYSVTAKKIKTSFTPYGYYTSMLQKYLPDGNILFSIDCMKDKYFNEKVLAKL